jgi:hypothetical protein
MITYFANSLYHRFTRSESHEIFILVERYEHYHDLNSWRTIEFWALIAILAKRDDWNEVAFSSHHL